MKKKGWFQGRTEWTCKTRQQPEKGYLWTRNSGDLGVKKRVRVEDTEERELLVAKDP